MRRLQHDGRASPEPPERPQAALRVRLKGRTQVSKRQRLHSDLRASLCKSDIQRISERLAGKSSALNPQHTWSIAAISSLEISSSKGQLKIFLRACLGQPGPCDNLTTCTSFWAAAFLRVRPQSEIENPLNQHHPRNVGTDAEYLLEVIHYVGHTAPEHAVWEQFAIVVTLDDFGN